MAVAWVDVNQPFRISMSAEMAALNQKFIASVNKAKADWANHWPYLHAFEITDPKFFADALDNQDKYPWLRGHLTADNIHTWHEEALKKVAEIPDIKYPYKHLVNHRYAYVLQNNFINKSKEVTDLQQQIFELREREHGQQFCNHPMCKTGVLIEVLTPGDEGPPRQLLIGDVNAYGTDGGCCPSGLRDEEIITRYRDFSYILQEP